MGPKDWGFDVAVTAAAFLFGCVQLMLAASSIVIPDLALRQYLGMVNVVPNVQVFVALAVTTLPLVVRRRFPWPVFLFCLVSFLGLQNAFNGFSLTIVGPVVALYTIASERGRVETVAAVLLAVAGLLFTDAHAATANMVLFTRFQNIVLAVAAGASGFLLKDAEPDEIASAVRVVAQGDALIEPSITRRLIETFVAARPASLGGAAAVAAGLRTLTDREREILALVARGFTNDEIGSELFISPATVKTHLARIMAKLDAHDRAQLVVRAYEGGLVRPGIR